MDIHNSYVVGITCLCAVAMPSAYYLIIISSLESTTIIASFFIVICLN